MSSTSSLSPQPANFGSPPITIVLTIILLVCFFVGFFSIYFCRCFLDSIVSTWNLRRSPSGNIVNPETQQESLGLDPSLIQIFPTFSYASVKDLRREKYGLECAICLAEFVDQDMLRLLTVCYHVFHQECIDLWLGSHKTCPVCRRDLDLPRETLEKTPVLENNTTNDNNNNNNNSNDNPNNALTEHAINIAIMENHGEGEEDGGNGEGTIHEDAKKEGRRHEKMEKFSRSHSTGHSILVSRRGGGGGGGEEEEEEDRYTLRLMENVKVKITRGHATAESCITFGDFSSPTSGGFGEVSGSGQGTSKL